MHLNVCAGLVACIRVDKDARGTVKALSLGFTTAGSGPKGFLGWSTPTIMPESSFNLVDYTLSEQGVLRDIKLSRFTLHNTY